jgi:hypothetical protein
MRRRCGASDPEHFAAVHLAPLGRVDQREKGLLIGVQFRPFSLSHYVDTVSHQPHSLPHEIWCFSLTAADM